MTEKSFNPAFITATASLMQTLDKRTMVLLRDGKSYIGILRTVDSYGTCVLDDAVERIYVKNKFGDIECGVILLRGENIAIVGECDDKSSQESHIQQVSLEEILELQKKQTAELIKESNNWRKLGIEIDKGVYNWFTPFSFFDDDS